MHVMYCALSIGLLEDLVIGCMVVPFCDLSLYLDVVNFYRLDVLCLVARHS
jgi:hypothetical protein